MEKNVIIKFIAESQTDAGLSDMEQFKQAIDSTVKKLQDLQSEHKKGSREWKEYAGVIAGVEKEFKDINAELSKSGKSIQEYAKNFSKINEKIAEGAVSTPKFTTQLRLMKDELAKLEAEGINPTDNGFISLAVKAAKMEDQIGDTRQRIAHLASDTKNLDAAMSLGSGLAGGFAIATSTAALLGGESEELQQAFFKVQAAISILNGVQQVANVLNKDSIANVVIGTAVEDINTVSKLKNAAAKRTNVAITALEAKATAGSTAAKISATIAQKALNLAMKANPAGIILTAIIALGGGLMLLSRRLLRANEVQEKLNRTLAETKKQIIGISEASTFDVEIAKAAGKSVEEIRKITREALQAKLALADLAMDTVLQNRKHNFWSWLGFSDKVIDQKAYDEAKAMQDQAYSDLKEFNNKITIEDVKARHDRAKKISDANKSAHEKALEEAKKRAEEIRNAELQLEDVTIAQMQEGQFKEIEQIRLNFERKSAEIKGNSAVEVELRKQLAQLMQREIEAVEMKHAKEDAEKKKETIEKALQSEIDMAKLASNEKISIEKHKAEMILASDKSTFEEKKQARERIDSLERESLDVEGDYLKFALEYNLISIEDYEHSVYELKNRYRELDLKKAREKAELEKELQQAVFDFGVQLMQMAFDYRKEKLQQEMEDLDHYYTTDAEEAKKNSDKKLITEQALAQKKLEIRQKQAAAEKAQALFQIAINTASAIMKIWADVPKLDFGASTVALTAIAAALGAAQAISVASKPLPKYAKGRKGGPGELAVVGELGPEVMWVPDGASIVPNGKKLTPNVMDMFGIPRLWDIDKNITAPQPPKGGDIDYKKLGKAVADAMKFPDYPQQRPVTVNVDRNGVTVTDGNSETTYLNKKYKGDW